MLHQATEGNPLFLGGVVQMLAAEGKLEHQERLSAGDLNLPANVRGAIERGLSGLSKRTSTVLSIGAVQGIEFDLALVERVAGISAKQILDCVDDAVSSGIVAIVPESRGHYRFTHALTRLVIYDAIASATRTQLHLRIAEALEEFHATDLRPHLEEIAYHFRESRGEGAEKAIEYMVKAGDAARSSRSIARWKILCRICLGIACSRVGAGSGQELERGSNPDVVGWHYDFESWGDRFCAGTAQSK